MTIPEQLNALSNAIINIKTEIENKGQTVSSSDTVVSLSNKIENISSNDCSKNPLKDIIEGTIGYLYDTSLIYLRPFVFTGCDILEKAYFTKLRKICKSAFHGCYNLKYLVLDTMEMVYLENINAFQHTFFEKSEGNILVPNNLLSQYLNDSNWSHYSDIIISIQ